MDKKIKHLEFIQAVITRMASNSFSLKGWAVTLVAGIFTLSGRDVDKSYFLVAYLPVVLFWGLDSYYLLQERLYRALYESVRKQKEDIIDFNMNASILNSRAVMYNEFCCCLLSKTELFFYLPLALITGGIIYFTQMR